MIQQSLNGSFDQFRVNCHMNECDSALSKLMNMLVTTKETLKSSRGYVLTIENLILGENLLEQEVYRRMSQGWIFSRRRRQTRESVSTIVLMVTRMEIILLPE